MRRVLLAACLLLLIAVRVPAQNLQSLFMKAKQQFRLANYTGALKTLDRLQADSQQPGNEAARSQLAPGLTFYKGACLAALGQADAAREEFELYLSYQPNPSLDPSLYPHRVIARWTKRARACARRPARRRSPPRPARWRLPTERFRAIRRCPRRRMDETWADGPARYLLTAQQRDDFERLSDPVSRSEFISEFWRAHDPHPETPENEFREEFERRVAYADVAPRPGRDPGEPDGPRHGLRAARPADLGRPQADRDRRGHGRSAGHVPVHGGRPRRRPQEQHAPTASPRRSCRR